MRLRIRHINTKGFGSDISFDARFLSGYSNTDPVTSWTNLSNPSNNATNISANAPTYKTSGVNGLPSVVFTTGKTLSFTGVSVDLSITVIVCKKTGTIMLPVGNSLSTAGPHPLIDWSDANIYVGNSAGYRFSSGGAMTSWTVFSSKLDSSNVFSSRKNGVTISLGSFNSLAGSSTVNLLGGRSLSTSNCEIAAIYCVNSAASNSVLKRLEHSAAFSFKIPCS